MYQAFKLWSVYSQPQLPRYLILDYASGITNDCRVSWLSSQVTSQVYT